MKIGVVTVYDSSNCGSVLQAFAMKTFLESQGHSVYFAKTRSDAYVKDLFYNNGLLLRSVIKYPVIGIRRYLFGRKKYDMFHRVVAREFQECTQEDLLSMDAVVLGSDEIWNVCTPVFQNSLFYGNGHPNTVAYAVSAGRASAEDFSRFPQLISLIRSIRAVFPRDENTRQIIRTLADRETSQVCDPTLLIPPETYRSPLPESLLGKQYLLIYAYAVDAALKKHIRRFAKAHHLITVSAGFFCIWADQNINCDPLQLKSLSENAAYVVTTTFHGTIFSVLGQRSFISLPGGSANKVGSLLRSLGLSDHMADGNIGYDDFCKILDRQIDYDTVNETISQMRRDSAALFADSLTKG